MSYEPRQKNRRSSKTKKSFSEQKESFASRRRKQKTRDNSTNKARKLSTKDLFSQKRAAQSEQTRIVGLLKQDGEGWYLEPTSRKERDVFELTIPKEFKGLKDGMIVVAEKEPAIARGPKQARLTEIAGTTASPNAVSLIAIQSYEIPVEFSQEALTEAANARPVTMNGRTDLRHIPFVTIDGPDARDFDDAVFAERNGDGWHLMVAIADVAHYVKTDSALQNTAMERGNSTYFPDRVVPMLPEALSNDLCSLMPKVDRACLAAHLWVDSDGSLKRWEFVRGVMNSRARLTYEQVQKAKDGHPDDTTGPLMAKVISPLYEAFDCLHAARKRRGTLDINIPERKVAIKNGKIKSITPLDVLDSHRLIEEFMITANVAAASQLEGIGPLAKKGGVCVYRVHDQPTEIKLKELRDFLGTIDIHLAPKKQLSPRVLTHLLEKVADTPHAEIVNEMVLRTQSPAVYSPENIGHFGLSLEKYAHFTSPIRRAADLLVHKALIRVCNLGDDGLTDDEIKTLPAIADHISATERRSFLAERDARDRFITLYMAEHIGQTFDARISGVTKSGLFAKLSETGAEGIIPINSLPDDYYVFDEKRKALVGRRTKKTFQLAQPVSVTIFDANLTTGSLAFTVADKKKAPPRPFVKRKGQPTDLTHG